MIAAFDGMEGASLSRDHVKGVPDAQGVYQLLIGDEIVYIGKTDSQAGLFRRLSRHAWTIQHRTNLRVADVSFKAVRIFVFTAMDLETQLIQHYRGRSSISWNNSGFGSNDPGRNRDKTRAKPTSFDVLYPIDLDVELSLGVSGDVSVAAALRALRDVLPYTLRVQVMAGSTRMPHPDLDEAILSLSPEQTTTRRLIAAAIDVLPTGWQATALAGRVILYKEHEDNYPEGRIIARN